MSKKKSDPALVLLKELMGKRVVSYHPTFAKAFGSINAAIFLSQGYFWQFEAEHITTKAVEGRRFFEKTIAQWYDATGLSEEQQKSARAILEKYNVMGCMRIGAPAKLHYHIDVESLAAVIYRYKETGESIAVDNRSKQRQYTRASGGKFRRLEAVVNGDTIKEETNKRQLDTTTESNEVAAVEVEFLPTFEEEKKEEKPSLAAPPPPADPEPQPQPALPTFHRYEPFDLTYQIEAIRTDYKMIDNFKSVTGVPTDLFMEYVKAFEDQETSVGSNHNNTSELRKHFFNFSRKRYQSESKNKPKQTADERFIANLNRTLASIDVEQFR